MSDDVEAETAAVYAKFIKKQEDEWNAAQAERPDTIPVGQRVRSDGTVFDAPMSFKEVCDDWVRKVDEIAKLTIELSSERAIGLQHADQLKQLNDLNMIWQQRCVELQNHVNTLCKLLGKINL